MSEYLILLTTKLLDYTRLFQVFFLLCSASRAEKGLTVSLIGVPKDQARERSLSLAREKKIDREIWLRPWLKSDATKVLVIERMIGFAAVPLLIFWSFLLFSLALGLALVLAIFKVLGKLFK